MRRRRRDTVCLNCGVTLDSVYNYCPRCGQENTNNNVNFKILIGDFINNYLAIDSRVGKSIKPFLTAPGKLTTEFLDGKRVSFAHPVRLYFILSLFYFFVFSLAAQKAVSDEESATDSVSDSTDQPGVDVGDIIVADLDGSNPLDDSLIQERTQILDSIVGYDFDSMINAQTEAAKRKEEEDREQEQKNDNEKDKDEDKSEAADDDDDSEGIDKDLFSNENWEIFQEMKNDLEISDQEILDSLNTEGLTPFQLKLTKQLIRVGRSEQSTLAAYILGNVPTMMFLLLPVFALILKLFYWRRKKLYIVHLVHAIHLHSFAYLVYGITILITTYLLANSDNLSTWLSIISFIGVSTYAYKSFRMVYKQGRWKTILKFNLVGIFYFWILSVSIVLEFLISLYFY